MVGDQLFLHNMAIINGAIEFQVNLNGMKPQITQYYPSVVFDK